MEEKEMQENLNPSDTAEGGQQGEVEKTPEENPNPIEEEKDKETPTTFTQEQVNDFVRDRLQRVYKGYGCESQEELNELVKKSQGYDELQAKVDALNKERAELAEKVAFMENNINPDRYDDIRAYFKGKELEFTNSNLQSELKTHNEWLNVKKEDSNPTTTINVLGTGANHRDTGKTEKQRAEDMFGFKFR